MNKMKKILVSKNGYCMKINIRTVYRLNVKTTCHMKMPFLLYICTATKYLQPFHVCIIQKKFVTFKCKKKKKKNLFSTVQFFLCSLRSVFASICDVCECRCGAFIKGIVARFPLGSCPLLLKLRKFTPIMNGD